MRIEDIHQRLVDRYGTLVIRELKTGVKDPWIEVAAELSVARATGFAALAILVTMLGLSFDPVMALQTGACLTLLLSVILWLKAGRAERTPYKRTETWLLLEPRPAVTPERAQTMVGGALRRACERYAWRTLISAVLLWAASLALRLLA